MKPKNNSKLGFDIKETLESNKKLVYILMMIFLALGIVKIYYEKSLKRDVKTEELEEETFTTPGMFFNSSLNTSN